MMLFRPCRSALAIGVIAALWVGGGALAGAVDAGQGGSTQVGDDAVGLIEAPDDAGPARADVRSSIDGGREAEIGAGSFMAFSSAGQLPAPADDAAAEAARASVGVPVVVELFTAQGCSTCPAADALLARLADRPDVLVLGWHVDYWDYLGWPDSYARPDHTRRQQGYAAAAGERGVYTPQIVVDGTDTLIGADGAWLGALIDDHASRPPAIMAASVPAEGGFGIDLTPRAPIPGGVQVTLVRYLPRREVVVGSGENRGHRFVYRNIVLGTKAIAGWPARKPLRLTVRTADKADAGDPPDTRHALILQQTLRGGRPGPILAAVRLD